MGGLEHVHLRLDLLAADPQGRSLVDVVVPKEVIRLVLVLGSVPELVEPWLLVYCSVQLALSI